MKTPNWNTLAATPLPADDEADQRLDAACDRITALLYRAHDLSTQIDPELGEAFVRTMTRAFRVQR